MGIKLKGLKFWRYVHVYSGRIIALFFLMWFVSGLILIYHPYPKISDKEIYSRMPLYDADIATDSASVLKTANDWSSAPIIRIDTLNERAQWVLFSKYEEDLPIYKVYYDDSEGTELFISGKSCKPIQQTTIKSRVWSYFGAIPHKLYIPDLRKNTDLWKIVMTTGGFLCLIAALSGFIYGILILRHRYINCRKIGNPYKKLPAKLHFGFGIIVGLFLITWGLSGFFSVNKVPEWISSAKGQFDFSATKFWGKDKLNDSLYVLSAEKLKDEFPTLKTFEKVHFGNYPAIKAVIGDSLYYFDARISYPVKMEIPENIICERLLKYSNDSINFTLDKLDKYTQYYMPRLRGQANLPVYEAKFNDKVNSTFYIDPYDGYVRYITDHKRVRKWIFEGLHYWNINGLFTQQILWTILIWIVCICCIIVCATGIIMFINRLLIRRR